jgi:PLP dependent protein
MSITDNLSLVKREIPANVTLVVISKTKPAEAILEAYQTGHKIFGENKVQELVSKYEILPKDIEWHLVGHLQSNKVKYIVPFIGLIHSVDSLNLLSEINKQALKMNRIVNCLLQIYIASEDTKFGLSKDELFQLITSSEFKSFTHISIKGLMGMASNTDDEKIIRAEFKSLFDIFVELKNGIFQNNPDFKELSMGMSSDYPIAIEQGATLVRIGSKIFGERVYNKMT